MIIRWRTKETVDGKASRWNEQEWRNACTKRLQNVWNCATLDVAFVASARRIESDLTPMENLLVYNVGVSIYKNGVILQATMNETVFDWSISRENSLNFSSYGKGLKSPVTLTTVLHGSRKNCIPRIEGVKPRWFMRIERVTRPEQKNPVSMAAED